MSGTYNATIRRVVVSAWIGNSIEYYDFLLYGLASALVFGPLFFPGASPLTATLSSFASFGVGFISRPLGALFFGNRGDTLGRKNTLLITLGGMGAVTFLIGACLLTPVSARWRLLYWLFCVFYRDLWLEANGEAPC